MDPSSHNFSLVLRKGLALDFGQAFDCRLFEFKGIVFVKGCTHYRSQSVFVYGSKLAMTQRFRDTN